MSELNIFQRISKVREKINYIQRDKSVSTGAGSYLAITHDAVTGMVRAALIEFGIVVVPTLIDGVFNPKEEGAKQRLYEATYKVDFVNIDKPDDVASMIVSAHALDNGDKAPGKAVSYATKTALLKMFNIETGESDESRYQPEDFDVTPFLDLIAEAKDLKGLQSAYTEGFKAAQAAKDNSATKTLIALKDKRKAELAEVK